MHLVFTIFIHSRKNKAECAYCSIPMESAPGYSENSGMGVAVCPPVAFSELVKRAGANSWGRLRQ